MSKFVVKESGLEVAERFLFSYSQCVLYWLKTSKRLATRGSSVPELSHLDLWWNGPTWLKTEYSLWPSRNFPDFTPSVLNELDRETNVEHLFDATVVSVAKTNLEKSLFGLGEKAVFNASKVASCISLHLKVYSKEDLEKF